MTKNELVSILTKKQKHLPEEGVRIAVDEIFETMAATLTQNERIEVRGFGSFSLRYWGPRYARNPETGESWRTEAVHAVHFRPAKELRSRVNDAWLEEKQANENASDTCLKEKTDQ